MRKTHLIAALLFSTPLWSMGSRPPTPTPTPVPTVTPTPSPTPTPTPTPSPTPTPPSTSSAPPARWIGRHPNAASWTAFSEDEFLRLGQDALTKNMADMNEFCENYDELRSEDKLNFWIYLLSSMTELESSFKPETRFQESFNDSQGRPVISRGLLQLSIESANGYGCNIREANQLHDAETNLSCGIRIINHWAKRDLRIAGKVSGSWRGSARYWSVLRNEKGTRIRNWTKAYCKLLK